MAGYAENRLIAAERALVEAHLGLCDECLSIAAGLVDDGLTAAAPEGSDRAARSWMRRLGPVFAVAVAAGVALVLWMHFAGRDQRPHGTAVDATHDLLSAAVRELARRAPEHFAEFLPLSADELEAGESGVTRAAGAPTVASPRGRVVASRPDIVFDHVEGSMTVNVLVQDATGVSVFERETAVDRLTATPSPFGGMAPRRAFPYPEGVQDLLRGGRYLVVVTADTPLGRADASASFVCLEEAEAAEWTAAAGLIRESYGGRLGALLRGHLALRRGLVSEAEQAAAEAAASGDADPQVMALKRAVSLRQGHAAAALPAVPR